MSKTKDKVNELREKLFNRKQEEMAQEATAAVEQANPSTATDKRHVIDVIPDPNRGGRYYLMVKIEFDIVTREAKVVDVREFDDKVAGLSIQIEKENRKYLYERRTRNENK